MGFKTIDLDTEEGRKRYEKLQKTKSIKKTFEDEENPFIEKLAPRPEDHENSEIEKEKDTSKIKKGIVSRISNLRVRNAPEGDILYLITEKSIVTIIGEYESWWKVETAPGKIGYVMKQYIDVYTEGG